MAWFSKCNGRSHSTHSNTGFVTKLKHRVIVVPGADDVTVALQGFEDQLQRRFAQVEAVAMPGSGQDVQDVDTFLCICRHRRKQLSTHRYVATNTKLIYTLNW